MPLFGMFIGYFVACVFSYTLLYHKHRLALSEKNLLRILRWGFFIRIGTLFLILGLTAKFSRELFYFALAFYFLFMGVVLFYGILFAFKREEKSKNV